MRTACCAALAVSVAALISGCGPVVGELNEEGLREYHAGHYIESIGLFKTALHKDIGRPSTLYYLGRSYLALAEERFRNGNSRMARRNLDDAVYDFDRAIGLFPNYEEAIKGRSHALELRGEYDKAIKRMRQSADLLGPSAKHKIMLAREYEQRGDFDNALNYYRQAIAIEPLNPWAHAEFGRFYLRIHRRQDAIAELTRSYHLDPQQTDVVAELKSLGAWPPQ
jgi:tetratricopeptide (TPR) repeat protein